MGDVYPSKWWYRNKVVAKIDEYINQIPVNKAVCRKIRNFFGNNIVIVVSSRHVVA